MKITYLNKQKLVGKLFQRTNQESFFRNRFSNADNKDTTIQIVLNGDISSRVNVPTTISTALGYLNSRLQIKRFF